MVVQIETGLLELVAYFIQGTKLPKKLAESQKRYHGYFIILSFDF